MKPLVDTVSPKANSRPREKQLNGGGSNKEADQRDDQITQTTGRAVVEIRQRTGHHPKREGMVSFTSFSHHGRATVPQRAIKILTLYSQLLFHV